MKVSIIGQGYVGLSLAVAASKAGHSVIGFDVDVDLVSSLATGRSHVEGIADSDLIELANYRASSEVSDIDGSDVVVIAVPTPLNEDRKPELKYLISACEVIAKNVKKPALIINESTSYPGTLRNLISVKIEEVSGLHHFYAASPERVDPGNEMWNQTNTPRLVAGLNEEATTKAIDFYKTFCAHVVAVTSPEVAEAAKLFENTFRQVNIAMVNELAQISHGLEIDVREVLDAAATKPFGFMKFNPSLGVGGHCIPVDPSYLSFAAEKVGIEASFIDLANEINLEMPSYVVKRISIEVGGLKGKKVLVAGLAYKANVSDLRESPSLLLMDALVALGAEIYWHDPLVKAQNLAKVTNASVATEISDLSKEHFDVAILAVAHEAINKEALKNSAPYIFDCTGTLPGVNGL
jgi:UDP-N-acetyl-D-glucosamine dehydrogenase